MHHHIISNGHSLICSQHVEHIQRFSCECKTLSVEEQSDGFLKKNYYLSSHVNYCGHYKGHNTSHLEYTYLRDTVRGRAPSIALALSTPPPRVSFIQSLNIFILGSVNVIKRKRKLYKIT